MSAEAVSLRMSRARRFYAASLGKKAVMAVTGFLLFGYLLVHLLGNLQIYVGPEQLNGYARVLHSQPALLWVARIVLLTAVVLHVVSALQLWLLKRRARPMGYVKEDYDPTGYASRTMMWSGPIIGVFVVFHVLHLTAGSVNLPYRELDAYHNVVNGFQIPAVSISYVVAMLLLCPHLYHGVWSMFQTLGISHPRYTPLVKRLAAVFAVVVAAGNISIPVSVLTGLIR